MTTSVVAFRAGKTADRPEARGGADVVSPAAFAPRPPDHGHRDRVRCELASSLAKLMGHDLLAIDIAEAGAEAGTQSGAFELPNIAAALGQLGVDVEVQQGVGQWPAIVEMYDGNWLLVLSEDGDALSVIDVSAPDMRRKMPREDLLFCKVLAPLRMDCGSRLSRLTAKLRAKAAVLKAPKARFNLAQIVLGAVMVNALIVSTALFLFHQFDQIISVWTALISLSLSVGGLAVVAFQGTVQAAQAVLTQDARRHVSAMPADHVVPRISMAAQALALCPAAVLLAAIAGPFAWIIVAFGVLIIASLLLSHSASAKMVNWPMAGRNAALTAMLTASLFLLFAGQYGTGWLLATMLLSWHICTALTHLTQTVIRNRITRPKPEDAAGLPKAVTPLRLERMDGRLLISDIRQTHPVTMAEVLWVDWLAIAEGQTTAVLGPNGAGKSALLTLLGGAKDLSHGNITVDGVALAQVDRRDIRRNIGFLSGDVAANGATLRALMTLPHVPSSEARQIKALEFAGLGHLLGADPRGLDRPFGPDMSRGDRQAIGWARLWLADPRIVLLDDPFEGLDRQRQAALTARLGPWLQGRTALIATHDPAVVALCSRIIVLQHGRVVMEGSSSAVISQMQYAGAG